jgi:hypothetical protein
MRSNRNSILRRTLNEGKGGKPRGDREETEAIAREHAAPRSRAGTRRR